jgi:hypothetical protein
VFSELTASHVRGSRSNWWKKGCTAPAGNNYGATAKTDQKEDGVDRGPNKPMPKGGSAFEKLQREREAKIVGTIIWCASYYGVSFRRA